MSRKGWHNGGVQFVKDRLWLGGSPYNAPAVMTRTHPQGPWTLHYVQRDNVGSIAVVTDSCGVPEQRLTYDAWGALKDNDYDTIFAPDQAPELLTRRGFGSHEHLPWFGLVNMNARLYEPATGRFLSPDPGIQIPTSTQNFNRYSYCLNNPLIYRDPTGEVIISTDDPDEIRRIWDKIKDPSFRKNSIDDYFYLINDLSKWTFANEGDYFFDTSTHRLYTMQSSFGGASYYHPEWGYVANEIVFMQHIINLDAPQKYNSFNDPLLKKVMETEHWIDPAVGKPAMTTANALAAGLGLESSLYDFAMADVSKVSVKNGNAIINEPAVKVRATSVPKYFKFAKGLTKGVTIAGVLITSMDILSDLDAGRHNRALMRLLINGGIIATGSIPYAGPIIAPCLSIIEGIWGDELIYNHF